MDVAWQEARSWAVAVAAPPPGSFFFPNRRFGAGGGGGGGGLLGVFWGGESDSPSQNTPRGTWSPQNGVGPASTAEM